MISISNMIEDYLTGTYHIVLHSYGAGNQAKGREFPFSSVAQQAETTQLSCVWAANQVPDLQRKGRGFQAQDWKSDFSIWYFGIHRCLVSFIFSIHASLFLRLHSFYFGLGIIKVSVLGLVPHQRLLNKHSNKAKSSCGLKTG